MTQSTKCTNDVCTNGNQLGAILRERKLTQTGLANASGVGVSKINYIVKERVKIASSVTADLICVALGLPPNEVFPNAGRR